MDENAKIDSNNKSVSMAITDDANQYRKMLRIDDTTKGLKVVVVGGSLGTVTSITQGTGILLTPSPITTTGSVALSTPLQPIATLTGNSLKVLRVNVGETAVEYATVSSGTVTSVSVTTANGVSGSVATATTTPAITLTLGAITPTTVNGLTITANGTNTLNITAGKTLRATNTLTFSGTDSTVMTFPTTSATIARTDAANTFTGIQTFSTPIATASVATMTATVGGGVPTPPNNTTTFLRGDGTFATPSGGGNVSNTGTPLDNQIAVFTNATTIEGTTGLTYDGSNFLLTGDIGSTGTRITKGWFTDLTVTNAIAGSITGNAATVSSANEATDTTCFPLFITASGTQTLATKNNTGFTYNSNTNDLGITKINGLTMTASTGTFTLTNAKVLSVTNTLTLSGTDSTTMTFPTTTATIARTDAGQTFTGVQTFSQIVTTNNAIAASGNAATVPITSRISTVTNNSAATLTITITTTSAVDGQMVMVRVLDFSAVAQTITWVNTEDSTVTAPVLSNGSTTLPLTVGFQYNNATSKWRCIGKA